MGRPLRHIPENKNGVLLEVTGRVIGARALLLPTPNPKRFNERIVGLIGRAMDVSPVELCACVVMANHYHALLTVRDQQQLSRFMHHFAGNLSKEVCPPRGTGAAQRGARLVLPGTLTRRLTLSQTRSRATLGRG